MPNNSRKTIFTTISIDKETATLVEKICKRYSLKKSKVVKLAFGYIDKVHINPSEAPESVKSELAKRKKKYSNPVKKRTRFLAILITRKIMNTFLIKQKAKQEILCYLFSHWEMAIITIEHRQRNYKHRNAKRKRRKELDDD